MEIPDGAGNILFKKPFIFNAKKNIKPYNITDSTAQKDNFTSFSVSGTKLTPSSKILPNLSSTVVFLSEEKKAEIGKELYEKIKLEDGFYEDKYLNEYLEKLLLEIKNKLKLDDIHDKVKIVNSNDENAFVSTDRHLYITKGLLKACETEEEILAVFAHELGHSKYNHIEKHCQKSKELQEAGVNGIVGFVIKNEYSKECEFQADQFAFEGLMKMDRNPIGIRALFGHLKEKEDSFWNSLKDVLIATSLKKTVAGTGLEITSSDNTDEKSKKEKEEKVKKSLNKIRFVYRCTKTHPYASERLERACTLINNECINVKSSSLTPKDFKIDEEEWIRSLKGTFDEKLTKFNERYPDGKEGRVDIEAQRALQHVNFLEERDLKLNFFANEHAETLEDFKKVFENYKVFGADFMGGNYLETYLLKMTKGKNDKIRELDKLWKVDFTNNFICYAYPEFWKNGKTFAGGNKDGTNYFLRTRDKGELSQKYYWSKRFGFRNFVKEHIFPQVNTREELKRVLALPFMGMDVMPIKEDRPSSTNSKHSSGLYALAKKVYKNETGKEEIDDNFLRFIEEVFKENKVDKAFLYALIDDVGNYYNKEKENNKVDEFYANVNKLVNSLINENNEKGFMSAIAALLLKVEPGNFEKSFCKIFYKKSKLRDQILFNGLMDNFTLEKLKSYLSHFTPPIEERVKSIVARGDKELIFGQKFDILKEFYPVNSIGMVYGSEKHIEYRKTITKFCSKYADAEGIIKVFKVYRGLREKEYFGSRFLEYPRDGRADNEKDRNNIKRLIHPFILYNKYGNNYSKQLNIVIGLLNCGTHVVSTGISPLLKVANENTKTKDDIDMTFASLKDIKEDALIMGENWDLHFEDLLDKGIELSAERNENDFKKVFIDLKRWSNQLIKCGGLKKDQRVFLFVADYDIDEFGRLLSIVKEKYIGILKRFGNTSEDAIIVINELRQQKLEIKYYDKWKVEKIRRIKNHIETGYDKDIAMAGFMGYFLDKREGKLPKDLDNHLDLIKLLMSEPSPLRDDILKELFNDAALTHNDKIKISDLIFDYKEKDEIKLKLYETNIKEIPDYEDLPYREKLNLIQKYFNEPSRKRDELLSSLENKHAQTIFETKLSSSLKFDNCDDKDISNSTYYKNNKYLLDTAKRAKVISVTTAGSLTKVLLRYFKGANTPEEEVSDEEKKIYNTIGKLHSIDRKNIIKEMLIGLDAFQKKYLKDLKIEDETGGFSVDAWKEEFINTIFDSLFKNNTNNTDNFMLWTIKEVFKEASIDRSASIISELMEAKTGNLKDEEIMFNFLKAGGPITRKIGQILSSNSLIPEKYQKEFAKLKLSEETSMDKEKIIRLIKSELNGKIWENKEWEECNAVEDKDTGKHIEGINVDRIGKLLGSASIRTVYKVRVNGKDYVAKINDPKAREMAEEDLNILDKLSQKLQESPELTKRFKIQNPRLLLHNLTLSLFQDIDSRIELINSGKLKSIITQEGNHTSKVYYAGSNVILEEYVDGKGIHKAIKEFKLNPDEVIDKILSSYAAQLDKGIFHADPHSENIMITKDGEVYWIDKSMTGDFTQDKMSRKEKNAIFDIILNLGTLGHLSITHGLTSGLIIKHLDEMARVVPSLEEKEKTRTNIIKILQDTKKGVSDKFYEIYQAAEQGGYVFSDNVFMLGKSLITLSGEIKKIKPNANIGDYFKSILIKNMGGRAIDAINGLVMKEETDNNVDILKDLGITNLADIPWKRLKSEGKISEKLMNTANAEFKGIKTEEDAIDKMKLMFLKYGNRLALEDIYFLINIQKTTKVLKALQ